MLCDSAPKKLKDDSPLLIKLLEIEVIHQVRDRRGISGIAHLDPTAVGPAVPRLRDKAEAVEEPAIAPRHAARHGFPEPAAPVARRRDHLRENFRGRVPGPHRSRRLDVQGELVGGAGLQVEALHHLQDAEAGVLRVDHLEGPGGLAVPARRGGDLAAPAGRVVVVPCPAGCKIGRLEIQRGRGGGWRGDGGDAAGGGQRCRHMRRRHLDGSGGLEGVGVGDRSGRGRASNADRLGRDAKARAGRRDAVRRVGLGGDAAGRGRGGDGSFQLRRGA
ncbi:hypothetical protein PG996_006781 [Apiospora saccharicola]|uniref:Uncharacterized protein n=1 Tax=Apiospora saccharicola TaxID=335842 RepID=A0ABR1VCA7_9PEZI